MRRLRWTWGGGSLDRLQEGANPLDRRRTRLSAPAQVKYETRIADCVAPGELNANYIVPSVFDPTVAPAVAAAVRSATA